MSALGVLSDTAVGFRPGGRLLVVGPGGRLSRRMPHIHGGGLLRIWPLVGGRDIDVDVQVGNRSIRRWLEVV